MYDRKLVQAAPVTLIPRASIQTCLSLFLISHKKEQERSRIRFNSFFEAFPYWVLFQFEFSKFCHNMNCWVLSQIVLLSCHNFSFHVLSQFEFLGFVKTSGKKIKIKIKPTKKFSDEIFIVPNVTPVTTVTTVTTVTIWVFKFCYNLFFSVLSKFLLLSFVTIFSCPEQLLKSSYPLVGPSVRLPLWKSDL